MEAIEDFEMKTGLLLVACMISMKDCSDLIKSLQSKGSTGDNV